MFERSAGVSPNSGPLTLLRTTKSRVVGSKAAELRGAQGSSCRHPCPSGREKLGKLSIPRPPTSAIHCAPTGSIFFFWAWAWDSADNGRRKIRRPLLPISSTASPPPPAIKPQISSGPAHCERRQDAPTESGGYLHRSTSLSRSRRLRFARRFFFRPCPNGLQRDGTGAPGSACLLHCVTRREGFCCPDAEASRHVARARTPPDTPSSLQPGSRRRGAGSRGFPNGSAKCRAHGGLRVRGRFRHVAPARCRDRCRSTARTEASPGR